MSNMTIFVRFVRISCFLDFVAEASLWSPEAMLMFSNTSSLSAMFGNVSLSIDSCQMSVVEENYRHSKKGDTACELFLKRQRRGRLPKRTVYFSNGSRYTSTGRASRGTVRKKGNLVVLDLLMSVVIID